MGSRLGVIVRTTDGWDMYYDRCLARTIGYGIALEGRWDTLRRICAMMPMSCPSPREALLGMDGTLFIDLDTGSIVWSEESECLYLPRLINALVELTWPGCTAIWSAEGASGTLRAAGIDSDTSHTGWTPRRQDLETALFMGPWDDCDMSNAFSCRMEDGRIITWRGNPDLECMGCLGPEQVHRLAEEVIRGCDGGKL